MKVIINIVLLVGFFSFANASIEKTDLQVCESELNKANTRILELLDKKIEEVKSGHVTNNENVLKKDYFKKVKISNIKAKYYDSLIDGKIPGITFKLKNMGKKTLSFIEVTVYFLDKHGNPIHEEKYYPVNDEASFRPTSPLKANYIWRIERGKFLAAKSVPKEWKKGKVKVEITDLHFSNKGE